LRVEDLIETFDLPSRLAKMCLETLRSLPP